MKKIRKLEPVTRKVIYFPDKHEINLPFDENRKPRFLAAIDGYWWVVEDK